jgi:hypothetical protein
MDFTLATLNGLIERDEQRYARQSDLAYLAHLDVTFIQRDGVWSFCINEVERPLMDLFSRTDVAERVMDELLLAMRVRIKSGQTAAKGPCGGPKRKRSSSPSEGSSRHCGNCGNRGHDRRKCAKL